MTELAQILKDRKGKELVGHLQMYLRQSFLDAEFEPMEYYNEIQDLAQIEEAALLAESEESENSDRGSLD